MHISRTLDALDTVLPAFTLERDLHNLDALARLAAGFKARSYDQITHAVGAVDGVLIPIIQPKTNDSGKYWTRKRYYAWNVQAVCDADCRITHISALCCGATHDSL